MRAAVWAAMAAAVLALAASERRADTDFEFDEAPEAATTHSRRPRRYVYDPQNPLCHELVCKKREVCLLRDAFTAQCANKKDILRRGDVIVAARRGHDAQDDDVFYEARSDNEVDRYDQRQHDSPPERCVGCGAGAGGDGGEGAQFVCGSDNRTYSSLCRLDLHNCVRRATVRLACRGFCPCRAARPARRYRDRGAGRRGGRTDARDYEGCELDKMANRLLDWFSVLMEEAAGVAPPRLGFPRDCKPEVRWMFWHLDAAGDGLLSHADLYALRHDDRERCLRPFLASCARGARAGREGRGLTRSAWCGCLRRAARPCAALARAHPNPNPGAYVPACDARGFYRPRQCHAALGVCWCVDAHGVERAASRTKGQPACPDERESDGGESAMVPEEGAAVPEEVEVQEESAVLEEEAVVPEEAGAGDDEDAAGSGDNELRF